MKKLLATLATLALLAGCASTPQEKAASALAEMQQEKNELIQKGVVAGFGIGESQDEQIAYDKADLNARTDIGRAYAEEVGSELTQHFEEVKKNVVSTTLRGATIIKIKTEAKENTVKVYAIMAMDPKLVREAFEAELAAQQADVARFRAAKAYGDANAEFAAYEAAKANK